MTTHVVKDPLTGVIHGWLGVHVNGDFVFMPVNGEVINIKARDLEVTMYVPVTSENKNGHMAFVLSISRT